MKVLRLGNKNKSEFILYCARLFVPLCRFTPWRYSRSEPTVTGHESGKGKKSKNILFFHSFALPLASPKVLRLGNKNKYEFILYRAQLFVPFHKKRLHSEKQKRKTSSFVLIFHSFALPLCRFTPWRYSRSEKLKINLVFRSLIRTFAPNLQRVS